MSDLTNSGLVICVKKQINHPYWYGCFGQISTEKLLKDKRKQYPKYYKAHDFENQLGTRVFDCMGLIKYYIWSGGEGAPSYNSKQDLGCTGMYNKATKKGAIASFPKKAGLLVFKGSDKTKTHVGVYVGDDKVIEAKGHAYGVIESKFTGGGWKYWAQCPFINEAALSPSPAPATQNIYIIKKGDTMWSIARKLGVTVNYLRKRNPQIKNINLIYPGHKIYY